MASTLRLWSWGSVMPHSLLRHTGSNLISSQELSQQLPLSIQAGTSRRAKKARGNFVIQPS